MQIVDHERLFNGIIAEGAEIGRLCRSAPDTHVRSCPAWTGADLLAHLTGFALWLPDVFAGTTSMWTPLPTVNHADALKEWDEALDGLVRTLRQTDLDAPVPNWSICPDTAEFWLRRSAHEFAVHRWDAATTADSPPAAVPADLARDGIEEYFDSFVATALATGAAPAAEATIALQLRDHDVTRSKHLPHPGPTTTLRGSSSEILLAMWHRIDPIELFVDGDRSLIENWPHI